MAETVKVCASVLGKGEARHSVLVDNKPLFAQHVLALVESGVTVVVAPDPYPDEEYLKVNDMEMAFGFLKLRAKGK